ncbi:MAG: PIN domain-containing protein [Kiritimatiellaeota bacterium]|nr:PIN domain-containing protein [Kiritimatiellota bacterium]
MKIFCDTSVMVAGSLEGHPHYNRAYPILELAVKRRGDFFCAAHSLAEMYNILTTLPVQPRIQPVAALKTIRDTILAHFQVVTLDADDYHKVVLKCAEDGLVGGVIYDALLLHCAATVKPDRIYTFNLRDFQRISPGLASKIMAP